MARDGEAASGKERTAKRGDGAEGGEDPPSAAPLAVISLLGCGAAQARIAEFSEAAKRQGVVVVW